jgi:formamidopyrimidine-DNA glycosylase
VPELPDVEQFRRYLLQHATGRTIRDVVVTDPGILRGVEEETLRQSLSGHRFEEPDRHGKWLIAWTTGPAALIHFGMTGDLEWAPGPEGRHLHDRVVFVLDGGELRYRNMRKLGGLWLAHGPDEVATVMGPLGPDALGVSRRQFLELLSRRRGRVKAALMDQRLVAGLGNILVDEILWQARVHPATPLHLLSETQRDRLFTVMRNVVRRAVERHGSMARNRRWLSHVRGLPGARCPRGHGVLERTVVAGRTTYHCPSCQPALH